jgi:hypothetical protein
MAAAVKCGESVCTIGEFDQLNPYVARAGFGPASEVAGVRTSDGDFGKYFHLPVSVNFGKWILFTGKLPVNKKNQFT